MGVFFLQKGVKLNLANDLNIILTAKLDTSSAAIADLNNQIKQISQKLDKLDLKINIDQSQLKTLTASLDMINKQIQSTGSKTGIKVFDTEQIQKDGAIVVRTLDEAIAKYKQLGTVTFKDYIDPLTNEMKNFTLQVEQADGVIQRLRFDLINIANAAGELDKAFQLSSIQNIDKTAQIEEQALRQTQQIQRNIQEAAISNQNKLNTAIQQAEVNITNLQRRMGDAWNPAPFEEWLNRFKQLDPAAATFSNDLKNMQMEFKQMQADALLAMSEQNKLLSQSDSRLTMFVKNMGKFATWLAAGNAIFALINQVQQGFQFMEDMSKKFTNLQLEMTQTNLDFNQLTQTATQYASALHSTTDEVMQSISVFGTYTSTIDQVLQQSKAAVILSNITGQSVEQSSNEIMATLEQFSLSAQDAMSVVDQASAVARQLKVDYPEAVAQLTLGMRTVGGVAQEAQVSLQQLNGMMGTLIDSTRRSGTEVGNALRTILTRLQRVGEGTNPKQFKKVEKALADVGIQAKSSADQIKPAYEILSELANKWNNLSDVQRAAVAEQVAGVYRINFLYSLMQHWGEVVQNTTAAENSQGVAMQKQEIYARSLQAAINDLRNAWQKLYLNTLNNDVWRVTLNGMTDLLNLFNKFASTVGGLPAIISTATAAITLFSAKARDNLSNILGSVALTSSFEKKGIEPTYTLGNFGVNIPVINSLKKAVSDFRKELVSLGSTGNIVTGVFKGLTAALQAFNIAEIVARASTIALQATLTLGLSLALTLAITKITQFADNIMHAKEKQKEMFDQLQNSVTSLSSDISNVQKLSDEYNQLKGQASLTAEEKQKLADVTKQLIQLNPALASGYDKEGNALGINTARLQEYNKQLQDELDNKKKILEAEFAKQGQQEYDDLVKNQEKLKELTAELQRYQDMLKNGSGFKEVGKAIIPLSKEEIQSRIADITKQIGDLKQASYDGFTTLRDQMEKTLQDSDKFKDVTTNTLDPFFNTLLNSSDKIKDFDPFAFVDKMKNNNTISQVIKQYQDLVNQFNKNTIDTKQFDKARDSLISKLVPALQSLNKNINPTLVAALATALLQAPPASDKAKTSVDGLSQALSDLQNTLDSASKIIKNAKSALDEYNNSGKFNIDTILQLSKDYPSLLEHLGNEQALRQDLINIISQEEEKVKEAYVNMLQYDESFYKNKILGNQKLVDALHKFYDTDLSNYKNLAEAKFNIEKHLISTLAGWWSKYIDAQTGELQGKFIDAGRTYVDPSGKEHYVTEAGRQELGRYLAAYSELNNLMYEIGNNATKDLDFSKIFDNNTKSVNSTNKALSSTDGIINSLERSIESLDLKIKELNLQREDLVKGSQEYRNSLHQENELYRQKLELIDKEIARYKELAKNQNLRTVSTTKGISSSVPYADIINREASKYSYLGITPALIAGIIDVESGFNPRAYNSSSGASGLIQFLPSTWREQGGGNVFDPVLNIERGVRYLAERIKWANGNLAAGIKGFGEGTEAYLNKVLNAAKKYGETILTTSKNESDIQQNLNRLYGERLDVLKKIKDTSKAWLDDLILQHENNTKLIEEEINGSKARMALYAQGTPEWNKEADIQIAAMKKEQEEIHKTAEILRQFNDGSADTKQKLEELGIKSVDLQKQINDLNLTMLQNQSKYYYDDRLKSLKDAMDTVDSTLNSFKDGQKGYNEELKLGINYTTQYISALREKINWLQQEAQATNLSAEAQQWLNEQIAQAAIDMLQAQEKLITDQINIKIKLEDRYYNQQKTHFDELKKQSDDYYDSQIKSLQKQLSLLEQQWQMEDQINKINEDQQKIQREMADKRYTYIDQYGNEVQTYNREKVAELQQTLNKDLKQQQRDRTKQALENKIKDLQDAKQGKDDKYQQDLQNLETYHNKQLDILNQDLVDKQMYYNNQIAKFQLYSSDMQKYAQQMMDALKQILSQPLPSLTIGGNTSSSTNGNNNFKGATFISSDNKHSYYVDANGNIYKDGRYLPLTPDQVTALQKDSAGAQALAYAHQIHAAQGSGGTTNVNTSIPSSGNLINHGNNYTGNYTPVNNTGNNGTNTVIPSNNTTSNNGTKWVSGPNGSPDALNATPPPGVTPNNWPTWFETIKEKMHGHVSAVYNSPNDVYLGKGYFYGNHGEKIFADTWHGTLQQLVDEFFGGNPYGPLIKEPPSTILPEEQKKWEEKLGHPLRVGGGLKLAYHDGGIIGDSSNKISELVNKLFNVKPSESVIKALKGELMIPPQNIVSNFIPNMKNLITSFEGRGTTAVNNSKNYYISGVTVKADNIQEFIKSIDFLASTT